MPLIDWIANLTHAQREAIQTIAIVIGSAAIPVFGFILTWGRRGIKRMLHEIIGATRTHDYVNGKLVPSSLGEMVRRTMQNTEDLKTADLSDLVQDPRTSPRGRRRDPEAITDQFSSQYRGAPNE